LARFLGPAKSAVRMTTEVADSVENYNTTTERQNLVYSHHQKRWLNEDLDCRRLILVGRYWILDEQWDTDDPRSESLSSLPLLNPKLRTQAPYSPAPELFFADA